MMSESQFGIRITSAFERSGAQAASSEMGKLGGATKTAAEEGHKLELSHREIKIAAHELLNELGGGGLAGALHGLFSVEAGVVFAGITALHLLVDKMEESRKKAQETALAFIELARSLEENHTAAAEEAAKAQSAFERSLAASVAAVDRLTQATARAITLAKEHSKEVQTQIDLRTKLFEARIKEDVAEGKMTPEHADLLTRRLEREQRTQKEAAEDEAANAEINAKMGRGYSAKDEIDAAKGKLGTARGRSRDQAEALQDAQDRKKTLDKKLEDAEKASSEVAANEGSGWTQTKRDLWQAFLQAASPPTAADYMAGRLDEKGATAKALAVAQQDVKEIGKKIADLQEEHQITEDSIKQLQEIISARTLLIESYKQEIDDLAQDHLRHVADRAKDDALKDQTDATGRLSGHPADVSGSAISDVERRWDRLSRYSQKSEVDQLVALMNQMITTLEATQPNAAAIRELQQRVARGSTGFQ